MYLIDTNVISELRKKDRAHPGVMQWFTELQTSAQAVYISSITVGELQRGVSMSRKRGDTLQAAALDQWLNTVIADFEGNILPFCTQCARVWGHLCAPDNTNVIDKQLAATALVYDLTLVTRNVRHVEQTGVRLIDPWGRS